MPLDWNIVKEKYGTGYQVPTCAGGKFLKIAFTDDEAIHIESPIWQATLHRRNLEKGVALIEEGLFVEDYMLYVANERATSVAHILRDLEFLDKTETFSIRC